MSVRRPFVVANLTSFSRRDKTVTALAALAASAAAADVRLGAVLVDDASTDGTAAAVSGRFPWVRVVISPGDLYWTRGMHRAMAETLAAAEEPDYVLWLNDDTTLLPHALATLIGTAVELENLHGRPSVIVGATADAGTGELTYSGQVARGRLRRFSFRKVHSPVEAVPCETMNGNVVLLPLAVVRAVGNLDPAFSHAGGDTDYGLRVHAAGFPLAVAPGIAGHCSLNSPAGGYTDRSAPLRQRWRHVLTRKGLPVSTWLPLTRKHAGWLWPLYFVWPYLKVLGTSLPGLRR